jgi:hypothetical protein
VFRFLDEDSEDLSALNFTPDDFSDGDEDSFDTDFDSPSCHAEVDGDDFDFGVGDEGRAEIEWQE